MIRKIHLDFHTPSDVTNVGAAFDPEAFAALLADAHVNYLATPGKCQYGNTYFAATVGHPHPGLVRPELFPETVKACVARGIKVQAYFTLGLDDVVAEQHPDWRQRYQDGRHAQWGTKHICFASPYVDDVVIPEALEMIERCPGICGFWFDICLYCDGAFYSPAFDQAAKERLSTTADGPRERWLLGRQLIRECCQRLDVAIKQRLPAAENYFNSLVIPGEPENIPLQPYQEVENPVLFGSCEGLSTGVRYLRAHGTPVIGLVSRFQGPWMDPGTLRTPDQLRFDVGRAVSLGAHVSMGDHRHPNGTLDPEVYRRIGEVYADVAACERWLADAKPCREAILLTEIERGTPHILPNLPALTTHAARLLEELGLQFDLASVEEDLPATLLVIWPGEKPGSPRLLKQLRAHVAAGGALLAMGAALDGLEDLCGAAGAPAAAGGGTGEVAPHGQPVAGPAQPVRFFRGRDELGVGPFAHVVTSGGRTIQAQSGTQTLADYLSVASQVPPFAAGEAVGPAIMQHGQVIYSAVPLFAENMATGTPFPRDVVRALCDALLARRLVEHSAGTSVAAHLYRVAHGYTFHLLHWALERWAKQPNPVADFPTLGPIAVELAIPESVAAVTLEPQGASLRFTWRAGVCRFTVPSLHVWQVVGLKLG